MKIVYTESFFKSLKRMIRHQSWYYKTWDFFRYNLPAFIKNIWKFRKELYKHREWDSGYSLQMLKKSLQLLADKIESQGNEVSETRLKKVKMMRRAVEILKNVTDDNYIGLAEGILGREVNCSDMFNETDAAEEINRANSEIFELATEIENKEWIELFIILKGQDHTEYKKLLKSIPAEERAKRDLWQEWYDGTGMKHWWN